MFKLKNINNMCLFVEINYLIKIVIFFYFELNDILEILKKILMLI